MLREEVLDAFQFLEVAYLFLISEAEVAALL
jgi:hypothetical protein